MSRQTDPLFSALAYYKELFSNNGESSVDPKVHMSTFVVFDIPATMNACPNALYRFLHCYVPITQTYINNDHAHNGAICFHPKFGYKLQEVYKQSFFGFNISDGVRDINLDNLFKRGVNGVVSFTHPNEIDAIVLSIAFQYSQLKYRLVNAKTLYRRNERLAVLKMSFEDNDKQVMDIYIDFWKHACANSVGAELYSNFIREAKKG